MGMLGDRLSEQDYTSCTYQQYPTRYMEITVSKSPDSTNSVINEGALSDEALPNWVQQNIKPGFQSTEKSGPDVVKSALRLIYQEWDKGTSFREGNLVPFSKRHFESISSSFSLPKGYLNDFLWSTHITPSVRFIDPNDSKIFGIVCPAPHMVDAFMTVVLVYDPEKTVTKGFLGCHKAVNTLQQQSYGGIEMLLQELRGAKQYAAHPLLLICLVYSFWIKAWKRELVQCRANITRVQKMLGHMEEVVGHEEGPSIALPNYEYAHRRLVITHSDLNSSMGSFVAEFGADLAKMFNHLNRNHTKVQREKLAQENAVLMDFFRQRQQMAKCEDRHKARLLARTNMQLKVLYNLMQHQDSDNSRSIALDSKKLAEASMSDSSSMKTIAALTMFFLPGTAVATIFSMSPFWDATGPILTATSDFWLYWVVTVPLTVIVLQSWRLWKRRDEARKKQAVEDVEKNFRGTTEKRSKTMEWDII